jgi:hypothetical protein
VEIRDIDAIIYCLSTVHQIEENMMRFDDTQIVITL